MSEPKIVTRSFAREGDLAVYITTDGAAYLLRYTPEGYGFLDIGPDVRCADTDIDASDRQLPIAISKTWRAAGSWEVPGSEQRVWLWRELEPEAREQKEYSDGR